MEGSSLGLGPACPFRMFEKLNSQRYQQHWRKNILAKASDCGLEPTSCCVLPGTGHGGKKQGIRSKLDGCFNGGSNMVVLLLSLHVPQNGKPHTQKKRRPFRAMEFIPAAQIAEAEETGTDPTEAATKAGIGAAEATPPITHPLYKPFDLRGRPGLAHFPLSSGRNKDQV